MFKTRTQKISFPEAERFIREEALEKLGRSLAQEEHYMQQVTLMRKEWASITDFILHDKFHAVSMGFLLSHFC